jgi:hypothetical protein
MEGLLFNPVTVKFEKYKERRGFKVCTWQDTGGRERIMIPVQ